MTSVAGRLMFRYLGNILADQAFRAQHSRCRRQRLGNYLLIVAEPDHNLGRDPANRFLTRGNRSQMFSSL